MATFRDWVKKAGGDVKASAKLDIPVQTVRRLRYGIRFPSIKRAIEIEDKTRGEVPFDSWDWRGYVEGGGRNAGNR